MLAARRIETAALLVVDGTSLRRAEGRLTAPPGAVRIDFTGKTITPALVDAHVHLGYQVGLTRDNFTRASCRPAQSLRLRRDRRGAVARDRPGDLPFADPRGAGGGKIGGALFLTAAAASRHRTRAGDAELKGAAYGVTTEEEARRAVREQVAHKVAFVKISGRRLQRTVAKLSPALYRAVIERSPHAE